MVPVDLKSVPSFVSVEAILICCSSLVRCCRLPCVAGRQRCHDQLHEQKLSHSHEYAGTSAG
jgi:hypothetical protein